MVGANETSFSAFSIVSTSDSAASIQWELSSNDTSPAEFQLVEYLVDNLVTDPGFRFLIRNASDLPNARASSQRTASSLLN